MGTLAIDERLEEVLYSLSDDAFDEFKAAFAELQRCIESLSDPLTDAKELVARGARFCLHAEFDPHLERFVLVAIDYDEDPPPPPAHTYSLAARRLAARLGETAYRPYSVAVPSTRRKRSAVFDSEIVLRGPCSRQIPSQIVFALWALSLPLPGEMTLKMRHRFFTPKGTTSGLVTSRPVTIATHSSC
jgi:hypothetical protein